MTFSFRPASAALLVAIITLSTLGLSACHPDVLESLDGSDVCVAAYELPTNLSSAEFTVLDTARIDSVLFAAVADSAFPGASIAIGRPGVLAYSRGYGRQMYSESDSITENSIYDLASMTKVVSTTTSVMLLLEAGAFDLDDRVAKYLPEFGANGKDQVKIIHLMTHTSGLIPFRPYHREGITDRQELIDSIMNDSLFFESGSEVSYSDLGMITMGLLIENVTGLPLNEFAARYIFNPLGMCNTGFRTQQSGDVTNVVPTEIDDLYRKSLVHGVVHDETAFTLGGTAGHAGLFSTATDLSRFANMLVSGGRVGDRQFIASETIKQFTTRAIDGSQTERGIGWDLKSLEGYTSAGEFFGPRSFGHTGYTGTSIWFDPDVEVYAIMLTNRVHPTRENRKISQVRPAFATEVGRALYGDSMQN